MQEGQGAVCRIFFTKTRFLRYFAQIKRICPKLFFRISKIFFTISEIFFRSYKIVFVTKFLTSVTKFVTRISKFVICVTKFVIKIIWHAVKNILLLGKNFSGKAKSLSGLGWRGLFLAWTRPWTARTSMPCTFAHTLKGNHLTRITYIPKPPCTRLLCEKWALCTLSYKKNAYLCKDIGGGTAISSKT